MQSRQTRRSVVRTAVWTVPAVTVVASAPALAATPGKADLVIQTLTASNSGFVGGQPTTVTSAVQVRLAYAAAAANVTSITLDVVFPTTLVQSASPTITSQNGGTGSFTFTSQTVSGPNVIFRFTWTGTLQPTGGAQTPQLNFTMPRTSAPQGTLPGTVYTATATSPTANTATRNETRTF